MQGVKFGFLMPYEYGSSLNCAILSERYGLNSVWVADHLAGLQARLRARVSEVYTTLTAIALKTKHVTLGTCVTDIQRRHPAVLAQTISTVDHISNGRLITGIGAGEAMNLDPYGIPWEKPVSRMREAIGVMQKLWTQDLVDYDGQYFKLKDACGSKPLQKPYPPLWIAGNSPRTIEVTAEVGDGWIPLVMNPENYNENLKRIVDLRKKIGKDSDFEAGVLIRVVAAKDDDAARNLIEMPARVRSLLSVSHSPKRLKKLLMDHGISVPRGVHEFTVTQKNVNELLKFAENIPFEVVEDKVVFGAVDTCIDKLEGFVKAGVRHFVLMNIHVFPRINEKLMEEQFMLWGKKIIPHFKDSYGEK